MTPAAVRRLWPLALLVVLPLAGAAAGRLASPALARSHYIVQVAERVWLEESQGWADRSLQSEAARASGVPLDQLFADAREVRERFRLGGGWLGGWCGLIVALSLWGYARERARHEFEADAAWCVECARCFMHCPMERKRRRKGARE